MSKSLADTQTRTDRAIERLVNADEPVQEAMQAAVDALNAEITMLNTSGQEDIAQSLMSIAVMWDDAQVDVNKLLTQSRDLLLMLGDKVRDLRSAVRLAEKDAANNYNSGFYAGMKSREKEVDALKRRVAEFENWYHANFSNTGA